MQFTLLRPAGFTPSSVPGRGPTPAAWAWLSAGLLLAWGGVLFGSFQYDDFANVLNDPATFGAEALATRLLHGIRPLTRSSYALCARLFGEWAGGWLAVQWVMHWLTALAVGRLTQLRTGNPTAAFLAAACFAFLPTHAATVAYVSGRSTGLATALLMGALLAHEHVHARQGSRRYSLLAVALFLLACAAKEIAIVFPALVLLWELTRSRTVSAQEALRRIAPYLIAGLLIAAVMWTSVARYRELLQFSLEYRPPLQALLHNLAALPASLSLLLRPWALSVEHAPPSGFLSTAAGAALIGLMIVAAARLRCRWPAISFALLWPLLALLPTHSIVAKLDSITEGPLYLASIGPAIGVGAAAAAWLNESHVKRAVCATAMLAAIGLCMWRTCVWSDPIRLWQEAVTRTPASARAWTNLGMAHFTADQTQSAQAALRTALRLDPSNSRAMFNLEIIAALNPDPKE